jgi:hypothetical protein
VYILYNPSETLNYLTFQKAKIAIFFADRGSIVILVQNNAMSSCCGDGFDFLDSCMYVPDAHVRTNADASRAEQEFSTTRPS